DRAGQRLDRVGRAGQGTERLDGPVALRHQRDQRAGGDEIDQFAEEGPFRVLGVVRLRGVDLDCAHLKRDYLETLALNSGNDITDDVAANAVRFDQDKGALRHYYSLRLFYGITQELTGTGACPGCRLRSDRGRTGFPLPLPGQPDAGEP